MSIDRLVKNRDECNVPLIKGETYSKEDIRLFLVRAKKNCYIAGENIAASSRYNSRDYLYTENDYLYADSFWGTEKFGGEEIVSIKNHPVYLMNYYGHVLDEDFNSIFLTEALSQVSVSAPYRGVEFYQKDDYTYHCKVNGDFDGYHGEEQIFYQNKKVYWCYFHGGCIE